MLKKSIRELVLKEIKPDKKEHKYRLILVTSLIEKLNVSANKLNFKVEFFIGGSFGKDTYLKNSSDVDLFCKFETDLDETLIDTYLEKIILDSKIKFSKQKGSRDYFSTELKKLTIEIIPVLNVESISDAKNTTDHSVFHTLFLKEKIKLNPKLNDEIRLTKQLFKAKGLYGAESYINGFSGHTIDLLILHYGSLENLLSSIKLDWREHICFDSLNEIKTSEKIISSLENQDKVSKLIILDPILRSRNASRALSSLMYYKAIDILSSIDELSEKDFIVKKLTLLQFKKNKISFAKKNNLKGIFYQFDLNPIGESEDIIGSKSLKIFEKIYSDLLKKNLQVFSKNILIDPNKGFAICSIFLFSYQRLPVKVIRGPQTFMKSACIEFKKQRKQIFYENDRLYAIETLKDFSFKESYDYKKADLEQLLNKKFDSLISVHLEKF